MVKLNESNMDKYVELDVCEYVELNVGETIAIASFHPDIGKKIVANRITKMLLILFEMCSTTVIQRVPIVISWRPLRCNRKEQPYCMYT